MQVSAEKAVNYTSWREESSRYSPKMMLMNSNTKYIQTLKSLGLGEEEVESDEDVDLEDCDDTPFNAIVDSYTRSAWPACFMKEYVDDYDVVYTN